MILTRATIMRAPSTLAAVALILLSVAPYPTYAQATADERSGAAKKTEHKAESDTAAGRNEKKAQLGKMPGKDAIPEPTVVLHAGEVPSIKFDSPVFDFGRVRAGTPVQHDFIFTNTGNGTLEILKAKAG